MRLRRSTARTRPRHAPCTKSYGRLKWRMPCTQGDIPSRRIASAVPPTDIALQQNKSDPRRGSVRPFDATDICHARTHRLAPRRSGRRAHRPRSRHHHARRLAASRGDASPRGRLSAPLRPRCQDRLSHCDLTGGCAGTAVRRPVVGTPRRSRSPPAPGGWAPPDPRRPKPAGCPVRRPARRDAVPGRGSARARTDRA